MKESERVNTKKRDNQKLSQNRYENLVFAGICMCDVCYTDTHNRDTNILFLYFILLICSVELVLANEKENIQQQVKSFIV